MNPKTPIVIIPTMIMSILEYALPEEIIYPRPAFAARSSAATRVLQAQLRAILIPVKVKGMADGTAT